MELIKLNLTKKVKKINTIVILIKKKLYTLLDFCMCRIKISKIK
jgi:hypothetical protein